MFLLVPVETDPLTKKKSGKLGTVWPSSVGSIEIVPTLFAKVVEFYM